MPRTVPSGTEKLTPSTATVSPKCLTRSTASIAGPWEGSPREGVAVMPPTVAARADSALLDYRSVGPVGPETAERRHMARGQASGPRPRAMYPARPPHIAPADRRGALNPMTGARWIRSRAAASERCRPPACADPRIQDRPGCDPQHDPSGPLVTAVTRAKRAGAAPGQRTTLPDGRRTIAEEVSRHRPPSSLWADTTSASASNAAARSAARRPVDGQETCERRHADPRTGVTNGTDSTARRRPSLEAGQASRQLSAGD